MHNALAAHRDRNPMETAASELARRVLWTRSEATGAIMERRTSKTVKLVVRKETLRQLRSLSDGELRAAAGGLYGGPPPPPRPSYNGC